MYTSLTSIKRNRAIQLKHTMSHEAEKASVERRGRVTCMAALNAARPQTVAVAMAPPSPALSSLMRRRVRGRRSSPGCCVEVVEDVDGDVPDLHGVVHRGGGRWPKVVGGSFHRRIWPSRTEVRAPVGFVGEWESRPGPGRGRERLRRGV
jgi:hypothetical protein